MEIKEVEKEQVGYPKINEISNTKLKKAIPNKWMKIGITSFLFNVLMKNKTFALQIAGGYPVSRPIYIKPVYTEERKICGISIIISAIVFFITLIKILRKKLTIEWSKAVVSKDLKVSFILSIILFIISGMGVKFYQSVPFDEARVKICGAISIISIFSAVATLIGILRKKIIIKWSNIKISKAIKVLFVISILGVVISTIGLLQLKYLL